jgi:anaerobic dimethyl sulfoxide reductase subunit A
MRDSKETKRIPFTCTLDCGSRCELMAIVDKGEIVRIDTPPNRPDTLEQPRLIPCARGRARELGRHSAQRVLQPLRRIGAGQTSTLQPIAWEQALDEIAERLQGVQQRVGTKAIMHATGAGAISGRGFSGSAASSRFFSYWGSVTQVSGNMSNHCATIAARWMLGERVPGSDRATLCDARLIILWGNNPAETRMGPNTAHFIAQARDRGARVILIDPRYTDSGILADQWIPIRPGTDAALAAAIAHVLETKELVDRPFLSKYTMGYEPYRKYVMGQQDGIAKTPEWAECETGVPADTIRQLAHDYGSIYPAALLPGWGPQRTRYGEQIARALIVLACMTGNVGVRGGGLASVGTRSNLIPVDTLPHGPHRPARHLPAGAWAQEIHQNRLDPPPEIAYIVATNLVNRSPNTRANVQALSEIDFVVVQDPYLTPTARCADIVLPVCTDLERSDLVTSWGHDLHLFYSQQATDAPGEAKTDYWILSQLAHRLGFGDAYTQQRSEADWLADLLSSAKLDRAALQREGSLRQDGEPRVALAPFRADPIAHPLPTRSGKIEIDCPQAAHHGLPTIPSYVKQNGDPKHPLQLLTPHSKLRSNSCLAAYRALQQLEPHRIWIHPRDATPRAIAQEDLVCVYNHRGAIRLRAKVTERIMPGVVCVYQGTWYEPGTDGIDNGGCANVLTGHDTSPTGGYATHSAWVEVRKERE